MGRILNPILKRKNILEHYVSFLVGLLRIKQKKRQQINHATNRTNYSSAKTNIKVRP